MPQTSFEVNLDCFLWDLLDEGLFECLDRIKGEAGVTGIVVPVHGRGIQQFRPHPAVAPRSYRDHGGAQFQPDPACYGGTRLRPVVSERLRKSNPLKSVVGACRQRGLQVGCALAACDARPVARRYEHVALRNAFGDRDDWLCPMNPDVQEYIRGLLADVTGNYGFDSVRLSDLGFPASWGTNLWNRCSEDHEFAVDCSTGFQPVDSFRNRCRERRGFAIGPTEVWLRTLCFCESCFRLATRHGVQVEAVLKLVSSTLETACRTGVGLKHEPADFVEEHPQLAEYLRWRQSQLHAWITGLKTTCRSTLVAETHQEPLRSGVELRSLADASDLLLCRCDAPQAQALEAALRRAADAGQRSRTSIWVSAGAECPDPQTLVAGVAAAARLGCQSVHIGDYGSVPLDRLDWIRQAARFARRESR